MKIVKNDVKIVCDVKGCSNLAKYKLILDGSGYDHVRLCERCLKNFYEEASKKIAKGDKTRAKG